MFLFCFKQKTAYEMRISDWSSDVCSSDLYRIETLLFASMILLTVGLLVRPGGTIPLLYTGAALIGCGITVGNVLMPAYLKERFPHALGWMTGLYAGFMNLFAALASGFSLRLG